MLKKLLSKLGYVPKEELETLIYANEKLNSDNIQLESHLEVSSTYNRILTEEYVNLLNQKDEEIHKLKNTLANYQIDLQKLKDKNESLKYDLLVQEQFNKDIKQKYNKESKRNSSKNKQIKQLKIKLDELESNNSCLITETHYLNQKVKSLGVYNLAIISRLEKLCFGSVLPSVMRQIDLNHYAYPEKRIKRYFEETAAGLVIHAEKEE